MASTSEVGHAKNVANFQDLIEFVNGYGATYNPSKANLTIPELQTLYTQANESLDNVITQNTAYNNAVNQRVEAFSDIRKLSTRLVNALQVTDASNEKIEDAKGFNRKLRGQRAAKKTTLNDPSTPAPKSNSASQQSYDQLIEHLQGLVAVLASEPSYTPNETELQVPTLQTLVNDLNTKNAQVAQAYVQVSNARINRNNILYNQENGLVTIASDVKKYVKSIFGASSQEYEQVKSIKFIRKLTIS